MLPGMKPVPNAHVFIKKKEDLIPKLPFSYTTEDWKFDVENKNRIVLNHQRLGDQISADSRRVIDAVNETTKSWQRDVDHYTKERIQEMEFLFDELNKQRKTLMLGIERLKVIRDRIKIAIEFFKEKSLSICKECFLWREKRIGIDLCEDDVNWELRREMKVIKGCQDLLNSSLKQAEDQIRRLNAVGVLLDEDLAFKEKSLGIDRNNLILKQSQDSLGRGMDLSPNVCLYTITEWQNQTYKNLDDNAKELSSAFELNNYLDIILQNVLEDIRNQTESTNLVFRNNINRLKDVKASLLDKRNDINARVSDTQELIADLQQELADKERSILLCRTRIANRARRPGIELTCDIVQDTLVLELQQLQASMCKLKQKLSENQALMRYYLHVQMILEEDINIKTNSLLIDEVECMTRRLALLYTSF